MTRANHERNARLDEMCRRLSRRDFLRGSGAALAGTAAVNLSFAPTAAKAATLPTKTLVYVFLRGGMDGLSMVVPTGGVDVGHYLTARNDTELRLDHPDPSRVPIALPGQNFGLHPAATGLKQLWDLDKLAIVHAAGHLQPSTYTRSHFDAQEQIELGTPGSMASQSGWLARHLATTPMLQQDAIFTALVSASNPPSSVNGWTDVATLDSTGGFTPDAGAYGPTHLAALRSLYAGGGDLDHAATAAVDAVQLISSLDLNGYVPGGGVVYPQTGIGADLQLVAQLMRLNLGIAVATVDYGGWDTHNGQRNDFANRAREISDALSAFYRDLAGAGRANDVAIVVQSEFGRQVTENADFGTDHGLGAPMFVIGGNVDGGFYGDFPGLNPQTQTVGDAVRPSTDFRQVLATAIAQLVDNPHVEQIFDDAQAPAFTYARMGFA
jgi:uncharacterized protein (DUF1501 family)